VQYATAHELRHLQLSVVDNNATLWRTYSHPTSSKREDLTVNEQTTDFQILSSGNMPQLLFIIDISTLSVAQLEA
jgi:hypothetical protein